tara:strand:- start:1123 stop:1371 length:249 start_codon:yes stop_codon:yes gene_type:complete
MDIHPHYVCKATTFHFKHARQYAHHKASLFFYVASGSMAVREICDGQPGDKDVVIINYHVTTGEIWCRHGRVIHKGGHASSF